MILRKLLLGAALAACLWTPVAAAGPAVSLGGGVVTIPAGQTVPFPVKISDVQGLYGFELQLKFDPTVVAVVDADPDTPGIQSLPGDFLALDLLVRNAADNGAGTLEYVMTQLNPSAAKSGSGTLVTILFKGLAPGAASQVAVVKAQFANRNGVRIEIPVAAGTVRVVAAAGAAQSSPTPLPTARPPQVDLTAVALTPRPTAPPRTATPEPLPTEALPAATQAATQAVASPPPASFTPVATMSGTPGPTAAPGVSAAPSPGAAAAVPPRVGSAPAPTVSASGAAAGTVESTRVAAAPTPAPAAAGASKPILPAAAASAAPPAPPPGGARAGNGILIGGGVAIVLGAVALGVILTLVLRQRNRNKA